MFPPGAQKDEHALDDFARDALSTPVEDFAA
jgi:hypothetical protein